MKNILKSCLVLLFLISPVFADIDWAEFGSFSDRSTLMQSLSGREKMTQEQKDLLKEKKLAPTAQCMITQIKKGNIENVKLLLEAKTNPNESYYMEYPIYTAAKVDNFEILKLLYDNGAKLNKGFYSELYEAVRNKNIEMAQYLLDRNARVDYTDSITQNTILYLATKNNMIAIIPTLIQKGAKIDRKTLIAAKKNKILYLFENNQ